MSNPFTEDDGPQPPKVLKAPMEIVATLRLLQQAHDPLIITFHERSQRFQSYLVEVDRDSSRLTLDEIIPNDGERYPADSFERMKAFADEYRFLSFGDAMLLGADKDS